MESIVEQMNVFFEPRGVAVIGASRRIMKAGHVIFQNFVDNRRRGVFDGELHPVNPNENARARLFWGTRATPHLQKSMRKSR